MDERDFYNNLGSWYTDLDEKTMTVVSYLEDGCKAVKIPVEYKICDLCEGRGVHVNPSIDSHGLTREDFEEDPDFLQSYKSGLYDVRCYRCKGKRVIPVPCSAKDKKLLEGWYESERNYQTEIGAERRFGA